MRLITPNNEGSAGNSRLSNYSFAGNFGRKFFIIENETGGATSVSLNLTNTGASGGFRIFPADYGSANYDTSTIFLSPSAQVTFSVDYNHSWGTASSAILTSSVPILDLGGTHTLIGPTTSVTFDYQVNTTQTKRELGSLLCQDKNGDYQVEQLGTKITEDETSFGLIRTNPKLTGNVKITIDSSNQIWLNSIDAVKDLADDRFKKFKIGKNGSYAADVSKFFDYGLTPPELVYALYQEDSQYTSTKRSFSQQYDRFYQYGVSLLNNKFYPEDFSFFAPLYLKREIPEYFVIFRTNGAINKFSYDTPSSEWASKTSDILNDSQIIKVFSLGENTAIGAYLRNIVNHPSRKDSDITVSYQKDGYTTFNGIAYSKGSFIEAGELLYDYFDQENPLIAVEEFTTLGFERNKVLSSHVINLEFLFDDEEAKNYSINRYFGLYVNTVDLAKFTLSEDGLQEFSLELGQLPLPRKGVDGNKISEKPFTQTNENGISIFADISSLSRVNIVDPLLTYTSVITDMSYGTSSIFLELPGNCLDKINIGDQFRISTSSGITGSAISVDATYSNDVTLVTLDSSTYQSDTDLDMFASFGDLSCEFYEEEKYKLFLERILSNEFIENQPRLFYLKDDQANLHSIKKTQIRYYHSDPFTYVKCLELKIKDTSLDISKLSGFTDLLTQTECKPLETRGRSSMALDIISYFEPNDYIEIEWNPGPTANSYPLRWRVTANETGLQPGESWPSYSLTSDNNGEYYLSYFHPGNSTINLQEFAKSIEDAFNRFPFKDFEVLAKNGQLLFRSTQDGVISESTKLTFNISGNFLKVMGIQATTGIHSVNFIGGSDRFFTRGKISTDIAKGLITKEYVSTKGSFSEIRKFNILDQKVLFAPYVDEPVYDEDGEKLIDFKNSDTHSTLCLGSEKQPIQLTSDKKLTTYEIFEPSVGILSIMPIRDFDTDFFFSEYTKSYLPELIEYFGRYAQPGTITAFNTPTVSFNTEFTFNEYPATVPFLLLRSSGEEPPVLHLTDCQLQFASAGATATFITSVTDYVPVVGDQILLMPDLKSSYFSDLLLSKFKGFMTLNGIISEQDEQQFNILENLWDPTRFTFQLLNSEYERMAENFLKTLVLKSRVVPYISKWVATQGKDIRDNQYRFNYHRAFGNMSFSPSSEMTVSDPRYHTHEWPYIDSVPEKYPISEFPEYAFSYMFETITDKYDFSSMKKDWFSEYFSTGYPVEKYMDTTGEFISAKFDPSEKYAYFNYNDYNDTTTVLFRGYRFAIKELDSQGAPVSSSTKYDNYRFSAIIETEEDDSFAQNEPIVFKTIVNEKYKFILLKITLNISSYRYAEGRIRYTDLYTLGNNDEIAEYVFDEDLIYSLPGYTTVIPTDKKLSAPINLSTFSSDITLENNYLYYDTVITSNDNFNEDLHEEIVPLASGEFSRLAATQNEYQNCYLIGKSSEIYSQRTLKILDTHIFLKMSVLDAVLTITLPAFSTDWENYSFYHIGGGGNSFEGIGERVSFAEILAVMSGTSDKSDMIYEIYKEDGTVLSSSNFSISSISPEQLTRVYDYVPVSDDDKPELFYDIPEIGSVLTEQKDLQSLYRYQGDFSPKFRDVLKFWLREDEIFTGTASRDFLLLNTHIGTELHDFSLMKNQYYTKVSDSEVLSVSTDRGYSPVYPLIGEIAIDKRDQFAWSSSWDKDYYRKYLSTTEYTAERGTLEMKEVKSVFGSKAMKIQKQFDLYQFKIFNSPSNKLLPYIENEFVYFENTTNAYLQVNVYNRLLREMMGTDTDIRARYEFLRVMNLIPESFDPSLINDYVNTYLKSNILDLFEISNATLYVLQSGNPGGVVTDTQIEMRPTIEFTTDDSGNRITLSETDLLSKHYIARKDTKITNLGNMIFEIDYPLDSRYYTSLAVGVQVRRI